MANYTYSLSDPAIDIPVGKVRESALTWSHEAFDIATGKKSGKSVYDGVT